MNTAEPVSCAPRRRKLLWLSFWFFFISSPFLGILGPIAVRPFIHKSISFWYDSQLFSYIAITFAGASGAGHAMARLRGAKTPSFGMTVRFACAIVTCYMLLGALMIRLI